MTIENLHKQAVNANMKTRTQQRFSVVFKSHLENINDFLGRFIKSIDTPSITFNDMEHNYKGYTFTDRTGISIDTLTVEFKEDTESLVSLLLTTQMLRQNGKINDVRDKEAPGHLYKFDIDLHYYNLHDEIVETITYKRCYIKSLDRTNLDYSQKQGDSVITCTIKVGDIDFHIVDETFSLV